LKEKFVRVDFLKKARLLNPEDKRSYSKFLEVNIKYNFSFKKRPYKKFIKKETPAKYRLRKKKEDVLKN
jgi:hypothetical protein